MERHARIIVIQFRLQRADQNALLYLQCIGIFLTTNDREIAPCGSGYTGASPNMLHGSVHLKSI